jgi:NAD(P)-dependent dehydrogenase (short-subunit alcohol dehydrogenase family)
MRIVMTGGTAGIGLVAARRLLKDRALLAIGARRPDRAPADFSGRVDLKPLDLADLDQVRAFAARIAEGPPIDVLLLNAGLQNVTGGRSRQGYELTFAANHLAHHLLLRLLLPRMAQDGRIILTASGTHDPAEKTGMPPPNHADARRLAYPEADPDLDAKAGIAGRRAYSTSKLCNVMTARELARRLAGERPDVMVAAFDPGFTPGTGLARDYPFPLSLVFRFILPLVVRGKRVSTPDNSGRLLAQLAIDPRWAGARGDYIAVRGKSLETVPPSALAQDDEACARLWTHSEALTGPI